MNEALPLIDGLWNYDDPVASEVGFKDLLRRATAAGETEYVVQVLTQNARAQGLQRRFEDAHETLDGAERHLGEGMIVARARVLLERGRVINSSGRPEDAVTFFERAWEHAREAGLEFYAVDAAHMLGIVHEGRASITWNERAIELARSASDPRARRWLGSLYNNLGWTYHGLGRYADALGLFEKDFRLRTERGQPVEAGIARWSMANALRHLGRVEEALEIQGQLLQEPERKNNHAEGYTQEEIAECLLSLGRSDEARPHFARAWELLRDEPWLVRDQADRLARLRDLGGLA